MVRGAPGLVDPFALCIFSQVRDGDPASYAGIAELAESIAANDLLTPLTVCVWDKAETQQYFKLAQQIFNGDGTHKMERRQPNTDGKYHVLVAGHRRRLALCQLRDKGCGVYQAERPGLSSAECFQVQFSGGLVPAKLYVGISPERGVTLQLEENINRKGVNPAVQARSIGHLYEVRKVEAVGSLMSVAEFARRTAISVGVVRDALRFCQLPRSIKYAVESGSFNWSCALELTYIQRQLLERPKPDGTLRTSEEVNAALLSLAANEAASRTRQQFRSYLKKWYSEVIGQLVMFPELSLTIEEVTGHNLGDAMVRGTQDHVRFLEKVRTALEQGWVANGQLVPLHRADARKALALMLEQEAALLSLLKAVLTSAGLTQLEDLVAKNKAAAALIEMLAGDHSAIGRKHSR
jgi:hypothetical protein